MIRSLHLIFIIISFSFVFGIVFYNFFFSLISSFLLLTFLCAVGVNMILYHKKSYLFFVLLFLLFSFIGVVYSYTKYKNIENIQNYLAPYFVSSSIPIEAKVVSLEKQDEYNKTYKVLVYTLAGGEVPYEIHSFMHTLANFSFDVGDIVRYESKIYPINNFSRFNYRVFLASEGVFLRSYFQNGSHVSHIDQTYFFALLSSFREQILKTIGNLYPKSEAILLGGILIGARENLPEALSTNFNNSGLTHIIAVSGFNITILILFVAFFLRPFPLILKIGGIGTFITVFTLLVGYNPPVVRAGIMAFIMYFFLQSGRKLPLISSIAIALVCMLLFNPFSISYDISFQLSFLSLVGVAYFGELLKKYFSFIPTFLAIKESLILTVSALLFTIPLSLYYFGQMSIIAPITNILVAPTVPIAMLLGFLSIIFSYLSTIISLLLSYFTFLFLKFDITIVNFFGALDNSIVKIDLGGFFFPFIIMYYLMLFFFMYKHIEE